MPLTEQLREDLKTSMRAHDHLRVSVIRGLLAAFVNELVATKRKPDEALPDDEALGVVRRALKQRADSIAQFRKGGREDLAKKEEAERALLGQYVPPTMPREEIEKVVRAKKEALGIADRAKAGVLMGAVMKELQGKADGTDVKAAVEGSFEK